MNFMKQFSPFQSISLYLLYSDKRKKNIRKEKLNKEIKLNEKLQGLQGKAEKNIQYNVRKTK